MAIARVVSFEGVGRDRIEQIKGEIESGERPNEVPATEILLLHDADAEESLAIVFFDNEADYVIGDAALSAMPTDDTPGKRTSVRKYSVPSSSTGDVV